jgi:hypothetical protein
MAKKSRHYYRKGDRKKGWKVFDEFLKIMNPAHPDAAQKLADVQPRARPPDPELTKDEPGVEIPSLHRKPWKAKITNPPVARVAGDTMETFETLKYAVEAGAEDGLYNVCNDIALGKVHAMALALLHDITALLLEKEDGGKRPIGLGTCLRRMALSCAVQQMRPKLELFFTSPSEEAVAKQAADIELAEAEVVQASIALHAVRTAGGAEAVALMAVACGGREADGSQRPSPVPRQHGLQQRRG